MSVLHTKYGDIQRNGDVLTSDSLIVEGQEYTLYATIVNNIRDYNTFNLSFKNPVVCDYCLIHDSYTHYVTWSSRASALVGTEIQEILDTGVTK